MEYRKDPLMNGKFLSLFPFGKAGKKEEFFFLISTPWYARIVEELPFQALKRFSIFFFEGFSGALFVFNLEIQL